MKVLLIDDFQKIGLSTQNAQIFIKNAAAIFGRIIISIDSIHGTFPHLQSCFENFDLYTIKPLGHKKTNDLIIKHHSLTQNPLSVEKQVFLDQIKYKYDQVRIVLGNKVIPSYPIFLLSILQSLSSSSIDLSETSYGYCYQSLIHYALASKAEVSNDDLGHYMNFIKILAYHFHTKDIDSIDEKEFTNFYNEYVGKYLLFPFDIVIKNLLKSQIIVEDENLYKFGYKYILYFLAAKHISDIINSYEGKLVVSNLFNNLHLENNANVLVFITHHTNDISFISDSMFHAMVTFENVTPITLNKNDSYYVHLHEISKCLSNEVIEQKESPEKIIENNLISQDNAERELERVENDDDMSKEISETAKPFLQAFRSIDIVGQIVKNRKGSLKKDEIEDLIAEIYYTGFRTVGFLGEVFSDAKTVLVENLSQRIKDKDTKYEIERKISNFIQVISLQTCLGVFSKLIFAVGIKDLNALYDNVAKNINTPAAKLVSFSINSYYNDLSTKDVVELAKEFKDNPVAIAILKSRVRAYIYTNHVNYRKKQRLAQALHMKISAFSDKSYNGSYNLND